MNNRHTFFKFVIPSIIAFALSGIYAIVDGFFVGNTIGDSGLSAINITYPVSALIQSIGTGIGMGGAVYYSINTAEGNKKRANKFIAVSWWLLLIASIIFTLLTLFLATPILSLLGANGTVLAYATQYLKVIALGATLQILGTGLIPFIRNYGSSFWAMFAMLGGFVTNVILDYLFVWVFNQGMIGAALATIIGQGVTLLIAIIYSIRGKRGFIKIRRNEFSTLINIPILPVKNFTFVQMLNSIDTAC